MCYVSKQTVSILGFKTPSREKQKPRKIQTEQNKSMLLKNKRNQKKKAHRLERKEREPMWN